MLRGALAWVAATTLLAAGCAGAKSAAPATPPSPKATAPTLVPPPAKQPITLAFAGDVHFEGVLRGRLVANPDTALGPIAAALRKADFAMVNLETAITTRGTPAPKDFTFRAPPTALRALRSAGVDVASMANNHGMDYGEVGLHDSLAAIKKTRFPIVGIGRNAAEAYSPYRTTVKGNRLAVIGATQVLDDHLIKPWTATDTKAGLASAKVEPRLVESVRRARANSDLVIVFLHWGQEVNPCPLPRQVSLTDKLIAAGADAIVGSHAHILLAGGFRNGRYVHYGLGNFAFYSAGGPTAQSGVLTLRARGRTIQGARWHPAVLSGGVPRLLQGAAKQQAVARWKALRRCANVTDRP